MKGLLLKDWLGIWKQYRFLLGLTLFYLVIGGYKSEYTLWIWISGMFVAMLPVSVLGLDERCRWDSYAVMLPCSKRDIVRAKYLFGIAGVFGVTVLYVLIRSGFGIIRKESVSFGEIGGMALGVICASLIFLSVNLPVMFKKGVEKGRLWFYMTVGLMMGAIIAVGKLIEGSEGLKKVADLLLHSFEGGLQNGWAIKIATVIITIAITTVSVKMSEHFYEKREV